MNQVNEFIATFTSSDWIYVLIFVIAIAEASVLTSFFISGTIGLVVVGILIAQEMLDPTWSVILVYTGTFIGDLSSFFLSRRLQRILFIRTALEKFEAFRAPLSKAPFRFILIGHFVPYLRTVLPVLAAGKVPPTTYIAVEAIAAFNGTIFFIGIGFVGAEALGQIPPKYALSTVGVFAGSVLLGMWIYSQKPFCPLRSERKARWLNICRTVFFYIWYLPWHPIRWLELWLQGLPSRKLRRSLAACFPDVQPGDVFLIRLHVSSPWGKWAHSAIAIDTINFVHGFSSVVTAHSIAALPVRYAIAHLRPNCESETAHEAAQIAKSKIGVPVSITARRDENSRFSCSSLVAYAFRQAGVELVDPAIARVVPNDLFTSPQMRLVRIVHTEKVSRQTRRYVFEAREEG
ncbi:MAG: DedA family protein [Chloroflexi bacterium]|nr:DedA family protein [Chloroflexota bacterium]